MVLTAPGRALFLMSYPALRLISDLLDIVDKPLIVGCSSNGQPSTLVARESPIIHPLSSSQGTPSIPARSTAGLLDDASWIPEFVSCWLFYLPIGLAQVRTNYYLFCRRSSTLAVKKASVWDSSMTRMLTWPAKCLLSTLVSGSTSSPL